MQTTKVKIIIFIDSFRIGGMHKQMLYLVRHLDKEVFEPVMVTSSPSGGLRDEFKKTGATLIDLGWKGRFDVGIVKRLANVINTQKPDCIFITEAQNLIYYLGAKLYLKHKPIQIGSYRALSFWLGHNKLYLRYIDNYFSRLLYNTSEYITANSYALKNNYSSFIRLKKNKPIEVIHNGSDFNFPISRSVQEVRDSLNISADAVVMIMVARLDPWKDFETLFKAISVNVKKGIDTTFIILGGGQLKETLEQAIADLNIQKHCLLVGEQKDIYNYINAADISVLSTNGEGFSNSVLESMALGKPVIATKVGGNTEMLGNENAHGILVAPKSVDELANAMALLANDKDLRTHIGLSGKKRIYELCDMKKCVASYEEIFLRKKQPATI